jgi:type IV pilus assembly protein PilC
MVDAGVSLVRCLDVLGQQTQDPKLKKIIWISASESKVGREPFPGHAAAPQNVQQPLHRLIRAGEIGGVLEETLQRLSHFLEKDVELRRKVKSAMTYPVLVSSWPSVSRSSSCTGSSRSSLPIMVGLGLKAEDIPAPTKFLIDHVGTSGELTGGSSCVIMASSSRTSESSSVPASAGAYALTG